MQGEQLPNTPLLYENRPYDVQAAIQSQTIFAETQPDASIRTYGYWGNNTYFYGNENYFTSTDVLNILFSQKDTLAVLDAGGGTGMYLQSFCEKLPVDKTIYPHILSLHNLKDKRVTQIDYKVGNAEVIASSKLFTESSMDLLYSHLTEQYFVDSLGTLQQLYRLLKKGGFLLLDSLHVGGIQEKIPDLIAYWQNCGHRVLPLYQYKFANGILYPIELEALFIQRTRDNLEMPVRYNTNKSLLTKAPIYPFNTILEAKFLLDETVPKAVFALPDEVYEVREVISRINIETLFADISFYLDRTEAFRSSVKSTINSLRRTMVSKKDLFDELDISINHAIHALWMRYASTATKKELILAFLSQSLD